jgi:hypothetical protein
MSAGIREEQEPPKWERARYGESQSIRLGFLLVTVSRPIGTRGGPRTKLRVEIGGLILKREFDDFPEAKSAALQVALKWLSDASEQARKLADATKKDTP